MRKENLEGHDIQEMSNELFEKIITDTLNVKVYAEDVKVSGRFNFF